MMFGQVRATVAGSRGREAIPVQPWMGVEGNAWLTALRDGSRTPNGIAADFMSIDPGS
jgi:hypothetical protein